MLTQILDSAARRALDAQQRIDQLVDEANAASPVRSLADTLTKPGLSVIAEIKRRSPSSGDIDTTLDPASQALKYVAGGADAISVLTEPDFFGGSLADLSAVRSVADGRFKIVRGGQF